MTKPGPDWPDTCWQQPAQEWALAQWALCTNSNRNRTALELQMSLNMDSAFPSRWLRGSDIVGKTVKVTIHSVAMEQFQDGTSKPAMFFEGKDKGVILNRTNAETIAAVHGKDMEKWRGKTIELFTMKVQSPQGGMVDGLRVRCVDEAPAKAEPAQGGDDLDDDIPF